jgi:hypothetical protein
LFTLSFNFDDKREGEAKYDSKKDTDVGEKIIEQEKLQIGNVRLKVFVDYLKSCSLLFSGLFMGFYLGMDVCIAFSGQYLSQWSNSYITPTGTSVNEYLLIYCMIGLFQSISKKIDKIRE